MMPGKVVRWCLALSVTAGCVAGRPMGRQFELSATRAALAAELDAQAAQAPAAVSTASLPGGLTGDVSAAPQVLAPPPAAPEIVGITTPAPPPKPSAAGVIAQGSPPTPSPVAATPTASDDLARALDEHRWTLLMEGRLADKQRLIDGLRHDLDVVRGVEPPAAQLPVDELLAELRALQEAVAELARARADETEEGPEDPLEALPSPAPPGPLD